MSNLATVEFLGQATSHLPLSWYFDPKIAQIEQEVLFKRGPNYVGHALMVPEVGDYRVLEMYKRAKMLVRNKHGVELISNICRHRQAIMLDGKGNTENIVCPVHRWTYDMDGKLLGAPHFPDKPCVGLTKTPLQDWQGCLFAGPRDIGKDLAGMQVAADLDFAGYVFDKVEVTEYDFNWKTFIEVYLEDYHVAPFHPGLGNFVACDDLKWQFGEWYSVQTVGVSRALSKPGTPTYAKWHEQVLKYRDGQPPVHGAIWLTYYPSVMIEWYPHVLVASTVLPNGPEKCTNLVEFYYPEDIALFEREFVEAEQKAYHETAVEDEEICQRMTDGRRRLWEMGVEEHGPYQSPMEDGMQHFHEFIRRELAPHLPR